MGNPDGMDDEVAHEDDDFRGDYSESAARSDPEGDDDIKTNGDHEAPPSSSWPPRRFCAGLAREISAIGVCLGSSGGESLDAESDKAMRSMLYESDVVSLASLPTVTTTSQMPPVQSGSGSPPVKKLETFKKRKVA